MLDSSLVRSAGADGLFAGIDWGNSFHQPCLVDPQGLLVETLQDQGHRLFCVSPKMSARATERYRVAPGKSDAFDAFVLADSLRHEHRHLRPLAVPSPLLALT